nr:glycoside hydrolase domain-containing protein [uncultured Mucilaginibacter sp.]
MKIKLLTFLFLLTGFAAYSQQVPYTNCPNCWLPDSLGNHRVVLEFNGTGKIAKAIIKWRRRDNDPQNKRIIVEDGTTHQKIINIKTGTLNREYGEIYFEPVSGKGIYYVYYMPYKNEGRSNYPKGVYLKPENTAAADWLKMADAGNDLPSAAVKEFQSIDAFNSFYPMEVIATKDETTHLVESHKAYKFLVFPEDRLNSIRMENDLPERWIDRGPQDTFTGEAAKGENFAFQLGIYALQNLDNVKIKFSDLKSQSGQVIKAQNIFCINTNGVAYDANLLTKTVNVAACKIQAMWCGIDVPKNAVPATYAGKATVLINGEPAKEIRLSITVNNNVLADGGVNEPWKMTRLKWLNSTLAQQNAVIAPYTPLLVRGHTISLLGRKVVLNNDGFPKQIQTFFTQEMTGYSKLPNDLLTEPIHFHFTKTDGKNMTLKKRA